MFPGKLNKFKTNKIIQEQLPHIGILYSSYRDGEYKNTVQAFDVRTLRPVVIDQDIEMILHEHEFTWEISCLVYGYKPDGSVIYEMCVVSVDTAVRQRDIGEFVHNEHMKLIQEIPLDLRCNVAWIGLPMHTSLSQFEVATLSDNFRLWDAPKYGNS